MRKTKKKWRRAMSKAMWGFVSVVVLAGPEARAEQGPFNIHLGVGGTALATDTAVSGVKRVGVDLNIRADVPLPGPVRMLAPQVGYAFDFLPGKSGVHAVLAGLRVRPLNDQSGYLWNMWPRHAKRGSWQGNLYIGGAVGYVYAPTTVGDKHWFGFEFDVGYQFSLASPIQIGPYVRYQHVVFKGSKDPIFIGFGLSISFGYPSKAARATGPPPKAPPLPRVVMPEPKLEGKPGDKDGDGVGDATDLCPISAPKVEVDKKGCLALKGKMVFPELTFRAKTPQILGLGLLALKRLSFVLKAHSNVYVTVTAFADDMGNAQKNLTLANKRAQAVRKALVDFGVQPPRITATGSGPAPPPAGTPQPAYWPRRVEFRFRLTGGGT
jgi:outer membrane protein OmpA-like peptidoglycan-associated protein